MERKHRRGFSSLPFWGVLAGEQGKAAAGKLPLKSNEKDPQKSHKKQVHLWNTIPSQTPFSQAMMCLSHLGIHSSGATWAQLTIRDQISMPTKLCQCLVSIRIRPSGALTTHFVSQKLFGAWNLKNSEKLNGKNYLFPISLPESGQLLSPENGKGSSQLSSAIKPLEKCLLSHWKKCVFLHCAERQILHILIRSFENLGKREKREPALLSSSLVKKSSESSGTWREL